jgi:hypothetical protein
MALENLGLHGLGFLRKQELGKQELYLDLFNNQLM